MAYDLSTYEGRQAARDAGNWVGADSSGNVVMEPAAGGGGGGGGGGTTAAAPAPSSSSTAQPGVLAYNTSNGVKSIAEMSAELYQVGWGGGEDVVAAYSRTTKSPVTPAAGATYGAPNYATGPGTTGYTPPLAGVQQTNLDATDLILKNASAVAEREYLKAKLALDSDELAFRKAQAAFANEITAAGLTGQYKGQPTQQAQLQAANLLGTYQGQQTLGAQQQYWSQAFQQQQERNKQVQNYLDLISRLRGPQDYGQYLRTMASAPQGLQSLVGAALGQYQAPGFGTTGVAPQPVSLGGVMQQAAGGAAPAGVPGQPGPTPGTTYEQYMQSARNLPPPSQIAPQNWAAMTEAQKQLLLGMYEQTGWNTQDVLDQYKASLPKFGATAQQSGTFKLV